MSEEVGSRVGDDSLQSCQTPVATGNVASGDATRTSITLTASAEYACYSPASKQQCWAVTSLKAPFYEPTSRAPVDIVAVIDKSGSMAGQKIALVKETLLFVTEQLKDCDRFSLVVYDTQVKLLFGLMKMSEENKEVAKSFVASIRDGSSTNLCGGLMKGMEQVAITHGKEKAKVQSVLLLTDGLANHGITHKSGIIEQIKKMQKEGLGADGLALASSASPGARSRPNPIIKMKKKLLQQQQERPPLPVPVPQQQERPPLPVPVPQQQERPPLPVPVPQQQERPPLPVPVPQQQELQQQVLPPPMQMNAMPMPNQMQQTLFDPTMDVSDESPPLDPEVSGYKFDGTIYTFGFGSDHSADLLEAISTQGGGVYYYIDSNEKIPESFADCLGGLLSMTGQNLSLKLEVVDENILKEVHANRSINWATPNKSCEIAMGDIQSEEGRDIVLEVELPPLSCSAEEVAIVRAQLSYFNIITSQFDIVKCELKTNRTDGERGAGNMMVDVHRNRISTTSVLKKAEALADDQKLKEAQDSLKQAIDMLEASPSRDDALCKVLGSDLKKCLDGMKSRDSYMGHGKLYMKGRQQSHAVQRSNFIDEDDDLCGGGGYTNMSKAGFRKKAKERK